MLTGSSSPSIQNLLTRTWSGALPLWQIFWLGLVLISFALAGLLRLLVVDVLFAFSIKNSLLLSFFLALPVLAFLWVAVWRSAGHSSFFTRNAARAIVMLHAIWYVYKFVRFLLVYESLA
jgi:hypothetical protein